MFPIADEYIEKRDFSIETSDSRKEFLRRQWVFCNSIVDDIKNMALQTYKDVVEGRDDSLIYNSCDFKFLESIVSKFSKS